MEVEKIIHYILIGNLMSGKVIYEMANTIEPKILYEANLIFSNFHKKKHHSQNTKISSFTVSIFIDNIIMIMKSDDTFPLERNFDLFKKIRKSVPDLYEISLDWSLNLYKQSLNEKITKAIKDYFTDLNTSRKALNTVSYIKNDITDIIEEETDENKKDSSISDKHSQNGKNMTRERRNSLISSNTDGENMQIKGKSKIFKNKENKAKISVKMIDDTDDNKTNMYKSIIQSSSLVRMNNSNNNISNNNDLNGSRNSIKDSHMTNKYVSDIKHIVSNISCCKRTILFFIVLIIIIQVVAIPLIILFSYSY